MFLEFMDDVKEIHHSRSVILQNKIKIHESYNSIFKFRVKPYSS